MPQNKVVSIELKVDCKSCGVSGLCLPLGLESNDVEKLDSIIQRNRPLRKGNHVFHMGNEFRNIFVVKTGTVKTYTQSPDGTEQVVGFYLPGEIIGLAGLELGKYRCSAKALETAAVCEIPFKRLEELTANIPELQHQLFCLMSKEISRDTSIMVLLGKSTAEERLAAFLLSLSSRFYARGFSPIDFNLSMSRQEIGSYLGLALETVSRLFTHFQEEKILLVNRKHVEILNMDGLHELLANHSSCLEKLRIQN